MKSKEKSIKPNKELQKLSISIGNFISYWGFRRIHGAIWTQLYLSKTPLSCTELTHRLSLSKALISPALDELCSYKLIEEVPSPNEKTKIYRAVDQINEVIRHVLMNRERKMLKQITQDFSSFQQKATKSDWGGELENSRIDDLGRMILSANLMLEIMLSQNDLMKLPLGLEK